MIPNEPEYIAAALDALAREELTNDDATAFLQEVWNRGDLHYLPPPVREAVYNMVDAGIIGTIH